VTALAKDTQHLETIKRTKVHATPLWQHEISGSRWAEVLSLYYSANRTSLQTWL